MFEIYLFKCQSWNDIFFFKIVIFFKSPNPGIVGEKITVVDLFRWSRPHVLNLFFDKVSKVAILSIYFVFVKILVK